VITAGSSAGGGEAGGGGSLAGGNSVSSGGGEAAGGGPGTTNAGNANAGGSSAAAGGGAQGGGGTAGASGGEGAIVAPPGYRLVWHDEFDVEGAPDPTNYKFEQGFVRNEEAQWYQSANAAVAGGMLVIEARKESVANPRYTGAGDWRTTRKNAEFTSASLNTSGFRTFLYGHFEMRARIPTAAGMWPAWWTLGVSGQWPANGEIDIMEFYQSKLLANVGWQSSTPSKAQWDSLTRSLSSLGAGWSTNFHVWTMDWDEQKIVLSVDGDEINSTLLSDALNPDGTTPFKQKAYLLVNLAIGGQNGGDPSKTTFPQRYEIDYLRVFQRQ
jgi:beta-glucanase (GH16 family)